MQIIDNFLDIKDFSRLLDIVTNPTTPYYFNDEVNTNHDSKDLTCYFTHNLFSMKEEYLYSNLFHHFSHVFFEKLEIKSLIRMKLNLYPRTEKLIEHEPHIDYSFPHKGCLFSFNTCDGATILHDGTRVKSVANRALIFEPHELHSSTNCTDAKARFNMNINYF